MIKLSVDIFAEELRDMLVSAHICEDSKMDLEGIRFLQNDTKVFPHFLYIGNHLPQQRCEPFHMMLLGGIAETENLDHSNVLVVKDSYNEQMILNSLMDVFQKYYDWDTALQTLLKEHAPYEEFLNISQPIFKTGICLMDWNHSVLAATHTVKMDNCPLWDAILAGYGYKYKFVIEHSNPKLADITKNRGMQQNWSNLDNRYLYNAPIFIGGRAKYGIGLHKIEAPTLPFTKSVSQLFQYFLEIMTERLLYDDNIDFSSNVPYEEFLWDTINGNISDPDKLNEQNNYISFCEGDYLAVGIISIQNVNYRSSFLVSCARELEQLWPDSICSIIGTWLVWVVNLKEYADFYMLPDALKERLSVWLTEKNAYCAFSPSFHKLYTLQQRYSQAAAALCYGESIDYTQGKRIFTFFDHLDYQLINLASSIVDVTEFVHPVLHTLSSFDRQHHTDYYITMKEYLLNNHKMAINDIAKMLHIHRNTLQYRLNKIQELTQVDFRDTETMEQIKLSVYCSDILPNLTYIRKNVTNQF